MSDNEKKKSYKKTIQMFFLIVLLTVITNGCVKQKNCDCPEALTGTWQYLEKPIYDSLRCNPAMKIKIIAVFTTEGGGIMYFTSKNPIPSRYQSLTPVNVRLCAKDIEEGKITQPVATNCVDIAYKLTCIEKED